MYTTEGIILKRTDVGEADSLFTLYTRDFGKMRALAQGVKKEDAKLKGHLEPFNAVALSFVIGKSGARLTHAAVFNHWEEIRLHLKKLEILFFMAETLDAHCWEGEKDSPLWDFFLQKLQALAAMESGRTYECAAPFCETFREELLAHLGYGDVQGRWSSVELARSRAVRYNGEV